MCIFTYTEINEIIFRAVSSKGFVVNLPFTTGLLVHGLAFIISSLCSKRSRVGQIGSE